MSTEANFTKKIRIELGTRRMWLSTLMFGC